MTEELISLRRDPRNLMIAKEKGHSGTQRKVYSEKRSASSEEEEKIFVFRGR